MHNKTATIASLAIAAALLAFPALSAEIEVKMLNKGSDGQAMVFEPATVKADCRRRHFLRARRQGS